jgi:hypothetical protein
LTWVLFVTEDTLQNVGTQTYLPQIHKGSPRYYTQLYQDAMAMVVKVGRPTIFVTVTCNPKWPEIRKALKPGQNAPDRLDIVNRVFKMKLQAILIKNGFCGQSIGYLYVVEFQKRGLPHAHNLIILAANTRPVTPEEVDALVCAELPDPVAEPQLYATVRPSAQYPHTFAYPVCHSPLSNFAFS